MFSLTPLKKLNTGLREVLTLSSTKFVSSTLILFWKRGRKASSKKYARKEIYPDSIKLEWVCHNDYHRTYGPVSVILENK